MAELQTLMTRNQTGHRRFNFQDLECVARISNIPVVESGWNYAGSIYNRIKKSNALFYWSFVQAESTFYTALDTASPAIVLFKGPISTVDKIVCKSLDIVEQRVPQINLPPQMIYWNTKQYVSDVGTRIVKPVLKRADSVKQIGNSVLASKYTAFAADRLDGALNVADMYVDKYLPADSYDDQSCDEIDSKPVEGPAGKAIQTIQHVDRFSRKLQRRLTRRTLAEAKALKEQSVEAVHVLIYVAELIATDPKLALQKGKELWANLSKDEPENQARPENLEQLIVLLTRESARRIVHFINFTSGVLAKLPNRLTNTFLNVSGKCLQIVDSLIKTVHLEGVQEVVVEAAKVQAHKIGVVLKQFNNVVSELLLFLLEEQLAPYLSGKKESKSAPPSVPKILNQNHQARSNLDTLYPPASPKSQYKAAHRHVKSSNANSTSSSSSNNTGANKNNANTNTNANTNSNSNNTNSNSNTNANANSINGVETSD